MIFSRYKHAADQCAGKRVLEVAAGSGQGLGLLSGEACHLVAGDIDVGLLNTAKRHYGAQVPLVCLDAPTLPFGDASFDVVLFFEALYYVPEPERALDEVARVIAPGGRAIIVNANPDRPDFIPSPRSFSYHSAAAFRTELAARGFEVSVFGAFPLSGGGLGTLVTPLRRLLSTLGLVPRTLRGRALVKRILYGKPIIVPAELDPSFGEPCALTELTGGGAEGFKVLYAIGTKA